MRQSKLFLVAIGLCAAGIASAAEDWIAQSNRHAQILLDVHAKYVPEQATATGVTGKEADIVDLRPQYSERQEADLAAAVRQLEGLRGASKDARVEQDLEILIQAANTQRHTLELNRQLMVPYIDLGQMLFVGFQKLLHEGIPRDRQSRGLLRLRRYAGRDKGYEPIAELARARIAEGLAAPGRVSPWTEEIKQALENQPRYLAGIRDLFKRSGLKGWQADFSLLELQMEDYATWLEKELLPRARPDNRLPEAIYADNLKGYGVYDDPREILRQALTAYTQIREEMAALAAVIASQHGYADASYPAVIHELKQQKIPRDRLLETYRSRLAEMEKLVRDHHIATLPARAAVIRLGTEAESAATPAPHIDLPPLIGNTGQPAAFVIPSSNPSSKSGEDYDDFSFDAVTWTLIAHEARPGHELQISRTLEHGVSIARAVFAFNSANVEGWALYAEAVMKPYEPLEGQLAALQLRLMRAARAMLDPMLNLGLIQPDAAKQILMKEVCLSEPMAKQEVDRYTFVSPGQATAYFYGSQILQATRARAEIELGPRFDLLGFHDFILDQGLLPLRQLDKAVMEEYVPSRRK
ncbi:MAG: DUF885 domain-containing protein [Steroidobacteraceae bacterium]